MAKESTEKIAVIADSPTCTGFRLSGVDHTFHLTGGEAEAKLAELLGDEKFGIIVVPERLLESCDWRLKKRVESTAKPVVIAIPDSRGPIEQEESLSKLIKRALGVDLAKKK